MSSLSSSLLTEFLQAGSYLRNWSPRTVRTYQQSLSTLVGIDLSKTTLEHWVRSLRERGLTPGGVNLRIRSVNSCLTWLHAEGHLSAPLRLKLLKVPHKQIVLFSDADVRRILAQPPCRALTLVALLFDTGIRIDEALRVERSKIDLDQLLLTVWGKGSKERTIPFSLELRKHLYRWMQHHSNGPLLFSTRHRTPLTYRNAYRDITTLCKAADVALKVHPHLFRHHFAATYIKRGGDIYRLSRLLGHSTISTTQLYLRGLGVEDLREGRDRLTPLHLG